LPESIVLLKNPNYKYLHKHFQKCIVQPFYFFAVFAQNDRYRTPFVSFPGKFSEHFAGEKTTKS